MYILEDKIQKNILWRYNIHQLNPCIVDHPEIEETKYQFYAVKIRVTNYPMGQN